MVTPATPLYPLALLLQPRPCGTRISQERLWRPRSCLTAKLLIDSLDSYLHLEGHLPQLGYPNYPQ